MKGWGLLLLFSLALGCRSTPAGPYSPSPEAERDTVRAQALNREAADLLQEDPERAETLLREALAADLFFGPAHNNLGVLYLAREELYEAASEFEWARKLMPGHPDPRLNLAITLERAGKTDEAIQAYEAALEVFPGYLPAIQGAARLVARTGGEDPRLAGWLEEIVLRSADGGWRSWAEGQRARRAE
ncbi:MAG: tetratricopeptide repeat protein [Candidatus Thermoplasmatota archaeon]